MTKIARIASDGSVEAYPLTIDDLKREMPLIGWGKGPPPAQLEGRPYEIVEDTPPPSTEWGETVEETTPERNNNAWRQRWIKRSISVDEAKTRLTEMAVEIYWQKMQRQPSVNELVAEGGSYQSVMTARENRFQPKLADVRSRIQAITTPAEGYAIYRELADLA